MVNFWLFMRYFQVSAHLRRQYKYKRQIVLRIMLENFVKSMYSKYCYLFSGVKGGGRSDTA